MARSPRPARANGIDVYDLKENKLLMRLGDPALGTANDPPSPTATSCSRSPSARTAGRSQAALSRSEALDSQRRGGRRHGGHCRVAPRQDDRHRRA